MRENQVFLCKKKIDYQFESTPVEEEEKVRVRVPLRSIANGRMLGRYLAITELLQSRY
jgi:hypothetical protein